MLPVADTTLRAHRGAHRRGHRGVIEEAVQTGNAVLVGRGAQCLLANRPDALHVFCYAPAAPLAAFVMSDRGVSQRGGRCTSWTP